MDQREVQFVGQFKQGVVEWKEHWTQILNSWVLISALLLISCVTLGKSPLLSGSVSCPVKLSPRSLLALILSRRLFLDVNFVSSLNFFQVP